MEKSIYHFKHSGPEADPEDIVKAKAVQTHLNKCTEAKRLRDWNGLITETTNTISSGADAAPQVYGLQAEALLKTHRHQEADDALSKCPVFDVETSTRYYGPVGYAGFLVVRAQVHLASGRFVLFLVYYILGLHNSLKFEYSCLISYYFIALWLFCFSLVLSVCNQINFEYTDLISQI